MSDWIDRDLAPVLDAVTILSPGVFTLCDDAPYQSLSAAQPTDLAAHPVQVDPLVYTLQCVLYSRCYSRRLGDDSTVAPTHDAQLAARLSQANHSLDRWDFGWQIYKALPTGQIFVSKGERQRSALPGEFITLGTPGIAPQVGATVCLRVQRESFTTQPGFYYMFSESPPDVWDDYYLTRLYFNCTPEGVPHLIDFLTTSLNRYQVPYQMKALSDAAQYTRTDAMVLYFARRYFPIVARLLRHLPGPVADRLGSTVPLFSKYLRAGIGLAENPNTGESFGMHRCRLTAEGIVDAWRLADQSRAARVRTVAARFALNGLTLERPYMNPGSLDLFEIAESLP